MFKRETPIGQILLCAAIQDAKETGATELPPELGQPPYMRTIEVAGNPLESPPPDVVEQGSEAILAYLRGQ